MEKSGGQAGKVPITSILDNQGSRQLNVEGEGFIEVEGPFPVPFQMENDSCVNAIAATSGDEGHEKIFTVTNEAIQSPATAGDSDGQRLSCSCQQDIELLKSTVKQLILKAEKQHEMIKKQNRAIIKQKQAVTEMKLSFRNFALSMGTCDDEEKMDGLQEFSKTEETAESAAMNPLLLKTTATTQAQDNFQDDENCLPITIVSCTGNYSDSLQTPTVSLCASSSLKTLSNEVGQNVLKINEEESVDMDHSNFQGDEDDDKDSLDIPDDDDESPDKLVQEMGNKKSYEGDNTSTSTTEHIKRGHSKKELTCKKCHLCQKVCRDASKLTLHIQSVHEGIRYKCSYCPGKFNRLYDVHRHEDRVHKRGKPTHQCNICGTHLSSEQSLNSHMSKIHKRRPATVIFQCQLCPSSFPERGDLHLHLSEVHGTATTPGLEAEIF